MRIDRIQYDADRLDEVVISNPKVVHLEAMGWHGWWMAITMQDGRDITFYMADVQITDDESAIVPDVRDDRLMCPTTWHTGKNERTLHRCGRRKASHRKHRCECGSRP